MGYTTKFTGAFSISPPVSEAHRAEYQRLVDRERDNMPAGAPDAYLQWVISEDGAALKWDGEEKFYEFEEWLWWLAGSWFSPKLYTLSGSVQYQGEDIGDTGTLTISAGVVTNSKATFGDPVSALREILRRYDARALEVEDAADLARQGLRGE